MLATILLLFLGAAADSLLGLFTSAGFLIFIRTGIKILREHAQTAHRRPILFSVLLRAFALFCPLVDVTGREKHTATEHCEHVA
jgi:hypothetical protein